MGTGAGIQEVAGLARTRQDLGATRAGVAAPCELDETTVKRLAQWAHEKAWSAPELLQQHTEAQGTPVHVETLIRYLKEEGLLWKRTRPSVKKKRDDTAFERCREELQALRDQVQAGAIELVYFDESGFAQVQLNRSAWTPCGEQHCIDALRGQHLNVMAALSSSGKAVHTRYWCSTTAEVFLGFVSELAKQVSKPVVIVLDNAAIHSAAAIQPALKLLQKNGVKLKFMTP